MITMSDDPDQAQGCCGTTMVPLIALHDGGLVMVMVMVMVMVISMIMMVVVRIIKLRGAVGQLWSTSWVLLGSYL